MKKLTKQQKRNVKILANVVTKLVTLVVIISGIILSIDVVRFPEDYLTTWNYQYRNDLLAQDHETVCHYYENYIQKDRMLWYDELDMRIMADYMGMTDRDFFDMYDNIKEVKESKGRTYTYKDFLKFLMDEK